MLKVYEITGANGLPYKVQLTPAAADKLGAVEVKDGALAPAPAEAPAQKKAGSRAKSASTASK